MNSSILTPKSVIIQGITGTHGSFHTARMLEFGTPIVAGTSQSKIGETIHGTPIYKSIQDIKGAGLSVDCSVVFVPPRFAKAALIEAIDAEIPLVVCVTEGIPVHDMIEVKQRSGQKKTTIIGPNCPGILVPGVTKLGIIPASVGLPGSVGVVSRSGTLTYEVASALTVQGIGQKYIIGIGGDRIQGTDFITCLDLFEKDPDVSSIVMIGEIGGTSEIEAAEFIQEHVTKPVYAYIAGHHAPPGVQLGHAGAILGSERESAGAKTDYLQASGVTVSDSLSGLITLIR